MQLGTVDVISSDPSLIEWHVQFTMRTLKTLSDQDFVRYILGDDFTNVVSLKNILADLHSRMKFLLLQ